MLTFLAFDANADVTYEMTKHGWVKNEHNKITIYTNDII